MGKTIIPDPLRRRHLIERPLSGPQNLEIAEAYLEEGRVGESLFFLVKAEASEKLDELTRAAIEQGDAFLLRQISDIRGIDSSPEDWNRLAEAAETLGKNRYAEVARRYARSVEVS